MARESDIDWDFLWMKLTERFVLGRDSVHGPSHWHRVEANGLRLANATPGADLVVVRLFAVFHNAERWDEASDITHGPRAARLVESVHGTWFPASEDQLLLLSEPASSMPTGPVRTIRRSAAAGTPTGSTCRASAFRPTASS